MNIRTAQQTENQYRNYWQVLSPKYVFTPKNDTEKKSIGEAKKFFRDYLNDFRSRFQGETRQRYALEKLKEKLENKTFPESLSYAGASRLAIDNFYSVMGEVEKLIKNELNFGEDEDSLNLSIDENKNPWTVTNWHNTLGMMLKRASYQYGEIKNRKTVNEQDEKIKIAELKIKSEYFSRVKNLLLKLKNIINGDNPENKKLAPNEMVPDNWLMGSRGGRGGSYGNRGGRYPGDNNGRYPGGLNSLDEGFSEQQQRLFKFPFGKGNSSYGYLYVHDLLRAYGLDSKPQYRILMGKGSRRELPSRIWMSLDPYDALDSLGSDKAFFYKYVPALNAALNEIIDIYTQEADNKNYDPKQVDIGKKYGVSDNAVRRWAKAYNIM